MYELEVKTCCNDHDCGARCLNMDGGQMAMSRGAVSTREKALNEESLLGNAVANNNHWSMLKQISPITLVILQQSPKPLKSPKTIRNLEDLVWRPSAC